MATHGRPFSSASSMVWPATNCSPIRRIARLTPWRISGSPPLATSRVSAADRPRSLCVEVSLPVSSRPQVAAFTNSDAALAEMGLPVAAADLVADQRIARLVVGNAQQRLGEAHQRHALLARQRVFVDQPFDAAAMALGAQPLDQPAGQRRRLGHGLGRQGRRLDQRRQALRLGAPVGRRDRLAQRTLRTKRLDKSLERSAGSMIWLTYAHESGFCALVLLPLLLAAAPAYGPGRLSAEAGADRSCPSRPAARTTRCAASSATSCRRRGTSR